MDAFGNQIARCIARNTDNAFHGIIGSTYRGNHGISRFKKRQKDRSQSMGAGHEVRSDQGAFRMEYIAPDFFQFLSSRVPVAVAVGRSEMIGRQVMFPEGT